MLFKKYSQTSNRDIKFIKYFAINNAPFLYRIIYIYNYYTKRLSILIKKLIFSKMFRIILTSAIILFCCPSFSEINISHAIAMHGEPKYKKDFKHVNYVNPNAFKGGEITFSSIGTYDTFNPFTLKGFELEFTPGGRR